MGSEMCIRDSAGSDPLSEANLRVQHAYLSDLLDDTRVDGGIGVGLPSAGMSADDVVQFWTTPSEFLNPSQNESRESLREAFVGDNATMMSVQLKGAQTNVDSRMVVEEIRDERDEFLGEFGGDDDRLLVAGFAAYNADNLDAIAAAALHTELDHNFTHSSNAERTTSAPRRPRCAARPSGPPPRTAGACGRRGRTRPSTRAWSPRTRRRSAASGG